MHLQILNTTKIILSATKNLITFNYLIDNKFFILIMYKQYFR